MKNVKEEIAPYVMLDNPIPFKEKLYIYPIKVKDFYSFNSFIDIFLIEKNKIPEVRIIQMNYLQFITRELFRSNELYNGYKIGDLWNYKFFSLLSLVFKKDTSDIVLKEDENGKVYIKIEDVEINAKEFDELRKIVLFQNIYDYDDTEMSDDFRKVVEEYYALKSKGIKDITLEDKIDVVMKSLRADIEQISNMTYRRLCKQFQLAIDEIDYIVGCYGYTREKPPEHWIYKSNKGKYDDVFIDADSFKNKIQSANK